MMTNDVWRSVTYFCSMSLSSHTHIKTSKKWSMWICRHFWMLLGHVLFYPVQGCSGSRYYTLNTRWDTTWMELICCTDLLFWTFITLIYLFISLQTKKAINLEMQFIAHVWLLIEVQFDTFFAVVYQHLTTLIKYQCHGLYFACE